MSAPPPPNGASAAENAPGGALEAAASSLIARAIESSEASRSATDAWYAPAGPPARRDARRRASRRGDRPGTAGCASSGGVPRPGARSCPNFLLLEPRVVVGRPDERHLALAAAAGSATYSWTGTAVGSAAGASVRNCFLNRVSSRAKSAGVSGTSSSLGRAVLDVGDRGGRPVAVDRRVAVEREPLVQRRRHAAGRARTPGSCGFRRQAAHGGWRPRRRCRVPPGRACRRRGPRATPE